VRAGLDLLARHGAEVVADLERPEALVAGVERAELALRPALAAHQGAGRAEGTFARRRRGISRIDDCLWSGGTH
jgi:hypothetical protein